MVVAGRLVPLNEDDLGDGVCSDSLVVGSVTTVMRDNRS